MKINKTKFIIKKPVELEYGTINFLDIEQYIDYQAELGIIPMNNLHLYYAYKKLMKTSSKEELEKLKILKDTELYKIVISDDYMISCYFKIFTLVTDFKEGYSIESVFESEERFMTLRKLIMEMNLLKEEKVFKNEELQEGHEMRKQMESIQNGESQSIEDIITSVVASTSQSFDSVCNMSIYQLYALYARVSAIMNYQTSTLFATVSPSKTLESWAKHIDLLAQDEGKDMKRSDFMNKVSTAF